MPMNERVANNLDPLTGRPLQITGAVRVCDDGTIRDDNNRVVVLSSHGDWIPVGANGNGDAA